MPVKLPARSPDWTSFAERWVKSVKEECLSKLILIGSPGPVSIDAAVV